MVNLHDDTGVVPCGDTVVHHVSVHCEAAQNARGRDCCVAVQAEVDRAIEFAEASPMPDPADLLVNVYTEATT